MASYFAHSENSAGIKHDLVEHLKSAAQMSEGRERLSEWA